MADRKRMYVLLLTGIDEVLGELSRIPEAGGAAEKLQAALDWAEEIYIETEAD